MTESAKSRILDSAERLFARHGFEATSLRAIIVDAKVNLAAVHYYFRSKEGLIRAVFERRFAPVNQERLRLLEACESNKTGRHPTVEQILEAFLLPMVSIGMSKSRQKANLLQLAGRILLEPGTQFERVVAEQFSEVARRFIEAFQRALPQLERSEIAWRLNFTIGAAAKALFSGVSMQVLAGAAQQQGVEESDVDQMAHRLIAYAAAGMKAPLLLKRRGSR